MSARNRPCPCGSGSRFKHCCGNLESQPRKTGTGPDNRYDAYGTFRREFRGMNMIPLCSDQPTAKADSLEWAPPGLLVIENFLSVEKCRSWRADFAQQPTEPALVNKFDPLRNATDGVLDEQRVTDVVPMEQMKLYVYEAVTLAYRDAIVPFFKAQLDTFTVPSILKYRPGGKYNAHADSEEWVSSEDRWRKIDDRDYSLLLYINDDYDGGSLYFPNFDIRIKPSSGMLVAFPSDHRYMHAAEPLINGERFVIVSWACDKRTPPLRERKRGKLAI
jgi:hypothetical protein